MLTITTPPIGYPVSLSQAKEHLRVGDDEDALITGYIAAATAHVEERLERSLLTQTLCLTLPKFPGKRERLELLRGPVRSLGVIRYTDPQGATGTFSDYQLAPTFAGADLFPAVGEHWPSVQWGKADALSVTYTAGYGEAADVPQPIREAILLLVGDFYEHRTETVVGTIVNKIGRVDSLLLPYRIMGFR